MNNKLPIDIYVECGIPLKDQRLTIVHPFYNDKDRLQLQWGVWDTYTDEIKDAVDFILVDDSSTPPVSTWANFDSNPLTNLSIYRIIEDLKFNTPGALNLGISQAKTDWVLIMDSDCFLLKEDLEKLLRFSPMVQQSNQVATYYFQRNRHTNNPAYLAKQNHTLACSILMHKSAFNQINGFDEDYTGARSKGYGYFDIDFTDRINSITSPAVLVGVPIQEYMDDVIARSESTAGVNWNLIKINRRLRNTKHASGIITAEGKMLRFEWELAFSKKKNDNLNI